MPHTSGPRGDPRSRSPDLGSDQSLVRAFQQGDEGACEAIYYRYCGMVHSLCYRMLHNHDDAREATQETFLRVYRALPRFNGLMHLGSWVLRIATNVCLDDVRYQEKRIKGDAQLDVLMEMPSDQRLDPAHAALRTVDRDRITQVLNELPTLHRAAIVLRDVHGLSYAEIAAILQVTECQVKNYLHRGRRAFREEWLRRAASILVPLFLPIRVDRARSAADPTIGIANSANPAVAEVIRAGIPVQSLGLVQQAAQVASDKLVITVAAATLSLGTATLPSPDPSRPVANPHTHRAHGRSTNEFPTVMVTTRADRAAPQTESPLTQTQATPAEEEAQVPPSVEPAIDTLQSEAEVECPEPTDGAAAPEQCHEDVAAADDSATNPATDEVPPEEPQGESLEDAETTQRDEMESATPSVDAPTNGDEAVPPVPEATPPAQGEEPEDVSNGETSEGALVSSAHGDIPIGNDTDQPGDGEGGYSDTPPGTDGPGDSGNSVLAEPGGDDADGA